MKKNFILTIALFATVTLSACSEIEDGVNRMDECRLSCQFRTSGYNAYE